MQNRLNQEKIVQAVKLFLEGIGENPKRQGLKKTPLRVARMCEEIFRGYTQKPATYLSTYCEEEKFNELVLLRNIPLFSVCEHHLLPFFGKVHLAYIPQEGRLLGISKLVRIVDVYASKLQIQERLTEEIADILMEKVNPKGVMVIVEAQHLCMQMRGVKKPGTLIVTSALRGIFLKDARTRAEVLSFIRSEK